MTKTINKPLVLEVRQKNKMEIEYFLGGVWKTWLIGEFQADRLSYEIRQSMIVENTAEAWFTRYDSDYNIEEFMMLYEEYMSLNQINFCNHLLQVFVEIDNHDKIPESDALGELFRGAK